jgi:hypothetical protein
LTAGVTGRDHAADAGILQSVFVSAVPEETDPGVSGGFNAVLHTQAKAAEPPATGSGAYGSTDWIKCPTKFGTFPIEIGNSIR